MKKTLSIGVIMLSLLAGCHVVSQPKDAPMQQQAQSIQSDFSQKNINGVITIFDGKNYASYGSNVARANQQFIPASTFKMLNALIALENRITTTTEVFKWDGQKRGFSTWEKDMTLGQAMEASAIPVYQDIARRTGLTLMQNEVRRVGFGNSNIGTQVDNFWLVGPLMITPKQEAQFAYRLAKEELPFSQKVQQDVKKMLLIEQQQGYKVFAKSGWGMDVEPVVGWYTGWVESPDGQIKSFALNIQMDKQTPPSIRKELAIRSLSELGLFPSH
ncbi:class D beta-lactamase [Snodgrassella sp. CFCC 13594]|uniref:class D beta-lactamase n=1 Tax=Snodgrassella sp. CFCC 13594 TaxID=1775559 RepID=UPI00082C8ED9|nr:class D beta-lactamase [Snodgrassella sp. CFCC 13594]